MSAIKLGVVGHIVAGEDTGRWVEVVDDALATGGFLLLTYENSDRSGEAHDSWVESPADVAGYFEECGWEVEWPE